MKAPGYWQKRCLRSELLVPFSVFNFLWQRIRRCNASPQTLSVPVLCVGNVVAGGAGKTPVAIAVAQILLTQGKKVAFVSRGYKGKLKGPVQVNSEQHTVKQVGDEPLLLAQVAPCWVGKSKISTAQAAIDAGAEIIILDDGMQNFSIHKNLTLVVIDGGYGFGNGLLLPAGPLRDRLDLGLTLGDAAIIVGHANQEIINQVSPHLPIYQASLAPTASLNKKHNRYLAFAGIGRPEKFFHTLRDMELELIDEKAFPDHYRYSRKDIRQLKREAKAQDAVLVTTEKDAVRLPPKFRNEVRVLPVAIQWQNSSSIERLLNDL